MILCKVIDPETLKIESEELMKCNVDTFRLRIKIKVTQQAHPGGRALESAGLRSLACCDCGFESRRGRECLSIVNVVCRQAEVSATGRSLIQRSPTKCVRVTECDQMQQ